MGKFANVKDLLSEIQIILEENKYLWFIERDTSKIIRRNVSNPMKACKTVLGILKNLNEENAKRKLDSLLSFLYLKNNLK